MEAFEMKSQTDLIVLIVAGFLTFVSALVLWFTKRDPVSLQPPTAVVLEAPKLPAGDVTFSTSLPTNGSSTGGRGGFGGGMPGMPGMAGMMGGGAPGGVPGGIGRRGKMGG